MGTVLNAFRRVGLLVEHGPHTVLDGVRFPNLTMIRLTVSLTIRSAVISDEELSLHFNVSFNASRRVLPGGGLGPRGLDPASIQDNVRRAMASHDGQTNDGQIRGTDSVEDSVRAMLDKQANSPEGIEDGTHPRPFVGVSQKSIFKSPCQVLASNAHKMAPRTG